MLNDVRVTGTKGEPNSAVQSSHIHGDTADATSPADATVAQSLNPLQGEERGILFVISSPSGGGKGTLIRRILPQVPRLGYSVSWTTRAARPGETHGVHYLFVTPAEFAAARAHGDFLESATVHGHSYGTSRQTVEAELLAGRDVVLEIDVQGAAAVRQSRFAAVSIFILPPSFEILRARLTARQSENPDELALRLRNSRSEVEHYRDFDYLVLNDDAERAATQLAGIVYAERARRTRQGALARRVLQTFPAPDAVENLST